MSYSSLARCVKDLENSGKLVRIETEVDPYLEIAAIQRRVFASQGPALLFTNVKGTQFPMVSNLFGTMERLEFIFREELPKIQKLFAAAKDMGAFFSKPLSHIRTTLSLASTLSSMRTREIPAKGAPVLANTCQPEDLPHLVSWPGDGGAFITLPIVYSEDPKNPGIANSNLGMYRIQMDGGSYSANEMGLHYQIHRGIGVHHAAAISKGLALPVHIYVGGPPSLMLAAVMPLPEGISELRFAGLLGGESFAVSYPEDAKLPVIADADFCIQGVIGPVTKPEGPFGDHMGYYSLEHPFPVLEISKITHRTNALWPCTTVGRPPQEDTVFGTFIHELTAPFVSRVFPGIHELHAVDAAGVHPLLLALGSERYTPYEARIKPRELITQAMHLLGNTQTALAKYLFIAAKEDCPALSVRHVPDFFQHMLERVDYTNDLHFLPNVPCDTLDYTGKALNEGSKLIVAVCGDKRRTLLTELHEFPNLPSVAHVAIVAPGILLLEGPKHDLARGCQDPFIFELMERLVSWQMRDAFPLLVMVDDCAAVAGDFDTFLWVTFTRSDPQTDTYGFHEGFIGKQWVCDSPLLIDARKKNFHPPVLTEDPEITKKVETLALPGHPLAGLF